MRTIFMLLSVCCASSLQAEVIEGFTEPYETVEVAAAEAGIVREILVEHGQKLAEGDLIGTLDTRVLDATLAAARARAEARGPRDSAQAVLEAKQRRLSKLESLVSDGHASTEEIERAKLDVALAKADVASAKEKQQQDTLEVKRIEAQIEQRAIRSSINGEVVKIHRSVGESVTPTDAIVATVVNLSRLRVMFHVPTKMALQLSIGQPVSIQIVETQGVATGVIDFVSPVTESKSGTVRVETVVDNAGKPLRSGLRCFLERDAKAYSQRK